MELHQEGSAPAGLFPYSALASDLLLDGVLHGGAVGEGGDGQEDGDQPDPRQGDGGVHQGQGGGTGYLQVPAGTV